MSDIERLGIGHRITGDQQRDAIHIAVLPVTFRGRETDWGGATPGTWVKFAAGRTDAVIECAKDSKDAIGILDPFYTDDWYVRNGEKVWVYLTPCTITGLRHDWTHPALDKQEQIAKTSGEHENWIRDFADRYALDYEELIEQATASKDKDWRYVVAKGQDLHGSGELGADHDLFWQHLEAMTNKTFDQEHREGLGWSCSC
jgi:hypothetical protein